jgi:hypothetical protein
MAIDYKAAKKLCTAAELALLEQSKPTVLTGLSAADLRRMGGQARRYSDKWRELAIKQGAVAGAPVERTQAKHAFFAEAVTRFEAKLAKLVIAQEKAKAVAKKAPAKAKKAPAKPAQASRKKAAQKKAAKKKVAARKAASPAPAKKAAAKKPVVKAPPENAAALSRESKGIQKGRVTSQILDKSGLNSRVKGHVSASGRRNQAARSSRKRS